MHAMEIEVERRPHYACQECGEVREGTIQTVAGFDIRNVYNELPHPELIEREDLFNRFEIQLAICPWDEGHKAVVTDDEPEIWQLPSAWECGNCGMKYVELEDARSCCQE